MAFIEYTPLNYISSKKSLRDKIAAIDDIIAAMILTMAEASTDMNPTINEYSLDDGQVKIKTVYRSIDEVQKGIMALENLKGYYENKLCGGVIVLRDAKVIGR